MRLEHEYALLGGSNRSNIGRWISIIAASLSALLVFLILAAVDLAQALDLNVNVPPIALSFVSAAAVYAALYWLFDNHLWKTVWLGRLLRIPDLRGKWTCAGISLDRSPAEAWSGEVTIVQSWDRLRIHLATSQSESDSLSASLQYDSAVGYRVMYHYRNTPRIGEANLRAHHGFAELCFAPDLRSANGEYFNGRGRNTYGSLELQRFT